MFVKNLTATFFAFFAAFSYAEIFGDGVLENGIEDSRRSLSLSQNAHYQRFFGTIVCDDRILGTALLLNIKSETLSASQPVMLTADHVLPENLVDPEVSAEHCHYHPAGMAWAERPIVGRRISGRKLAVSNEGMSDSIVGDFSNDWLVVALEAWPNWVNNALLMSLDTSLISDVNSDIETSAFFVGFDGTQTGFKVDMDCRFGSFADDQFFGVAKTAGFRGLVWDDCDSVSGSSGGVLFEVSGNAHSEKSAYQAAAIRVGNLFDQQRYPAGPAPGDKFDLNANFNVARLIDEEMRDAIRELLSQNFGARD